jgi:hypothetical protein
MAKDVVGVLICLGGGLEDTKFLEIFKNGRSIGIISIPQDLINL